MTKRSMTRKVKIQQALQLAHTLYLKGYPFYSVTLYLGGIYPVVECFDVEASIAHAVICTDRRNDGNAQRYLEQYTASHDNETDNPCGLITHLMQPGDKPDTFTMTDDEWIQDLLT